jgi:cytochrome c oxidase cbb3-type subunit III
MIDPPPPLQPKATDRSRLLVSLGIIAVIFLLAVAGVLFSHHRQHERLGNLLLAMNGEAVPEDRALIAFAAIQAKPLYAANCARCHGADMRGTQSLGAPNLIDGRWLYGEGSVFDIERTVLYGVRSEHGKSHNVTDMPPYGLTGRLSDAEIRALVQYLLQLRGLPHQAGAADEGRAVYFDVDKANCADCHGDSARGNSNYGAPDLTANLAAGVGAHADTARTLYDAIYFGQHRIMPGWIGTLTLVQIRALAVYVYSKSHRLGDV